MESLTSLVKTHRIRDLAALKQEFRHRALGAHPDLGGQGFPELQEDWQRAKDLLETLPSPGTPGSKASALNLEEIFCDLVSAGYPLTEAAALRNTGYLRRHRILLTGFEAWTGEPWTLDEALIPQLKIQNADLYLVWQKALNLLRDWGITHFSYLQRTLESQILQAAETLEAGGFGSLGTFLVAVHRGLTSGPAE